MKKIGSYMVIVGVFAIVLGFLDRVPKILIWIYSWGDTVAWAIKIGLIVVGAALFLIGGGDQEEALPEEPSES